MTRLVEVLIITDKIYSVSGIIPLNKEISALDMKGEP